MSAIVGPGQRQRTVDVEHRSTEPVARAADRRISTGAGSTAGAAFGVVARQGRIGDRHRPEQREHRPAHPGAAATETIDGVAPPAEAGRGGAAAAAAATTTESAVTAPAAGGILRSNATAAESAARTAVAAAAADATAAATREVTAAGDHGDGPALAKPAAGRAIVIPDSPPET